jgi:hypothetical protein
MSRLNLGLTLLAAVIAVLVFAPTIVFWQMFGFSAVVAHWAGVWMLVALTLLGVLLVFVRRPRRGPAKLEDEEARRRLYLGLAMFGLVAAILVFAPTVVFWSMFGFRAVVAHWVSVIALVIMTFLGLYLIFTDKRLPVRR